MSLLLVGWTFFLGMSGINLSFKKVNSVLHRFQFKANAKYISAEAETFRTAADLELSGLLILGCYWTLDFKKSPFCWWYKFSKY